jgi:hypothetical protein
MRLAAECLSSSLTDDPGAVVRWIETQLTSSRNIFSNADLPEDSPPGVAIELRLLLQSTIAIHMDRGRDVVAILQEWLDLSTESAEAIKEVLVLREIRLLGKTSGLLSARMQHAVRYALLGHAAAEGDPVAKLERIRNLFQDATDAAEYFVEIRNLVASRPLPSRWWPSARRAARADRDDRLEYINFKMQQLEYWIDALAADNLGTAAKFRGLADLEHLLLQSNSPRVQDFTQLEGLARSEAAEDAIDLGDALVVATEEWFFEEAHGLLGEAWRSLLLPAGVGFDPLGPQTPIPNWLNTLLVGHAIRRERLSPTRIFAIGIRTATEDVDNVLNFLGPPPDSTVGPSLPRPMMPAGVS